MNKELRDRHQEIQIKEGRVRDATESLKQYQSHAQERDKMMQAVTELNLEIERLQREIDVRSY